MSKKNSGKQNHSSSKTQNNNPETIPTLPVESNPTLSFDQLKDNLPTIVPSNLQLSVQETPSQDEVKIIIDDANSKAVDILNDAKLAIIKSYAKNESERAERQKPLLWVVIGLTALQLIAFNVIIGLIAWAAFKTESSEIILQLFEILKYYIGATVVELIGMVWFITRDTFSSNHIKMMKLMFGDRSDEKQESGKKDS